MKVFFQHQVHNGESLSLSSTRHQPCLILQKLDCSKWYSLVFFDPDAVGGNKIHWLVVNIQTQTMHGKTVFPYVPPHPPTNSGRHHYIFWICKHAEPIHIGHNALANRFVDILMVMKRLGLTCKDIVDTFFFVIDTKENNVVVS